MITQFKFPLPSTSKLKKRVRDLLYEHVVCDDIPIVTELVVKALNTADMSAGNGVTDRCTLSSGKYSVNVNVSTGEISLYKVIIP